MKLNERFLKSLSLIKHKKVKIGIAFGGGGARGFVHLGVIKALEEYGLQFDVIVGTSAGSIVGALLANGLSYMQILKIAKGLNMKEIRTNKIPYMTSKTDGLEKTIISAIGADINIEELKIPFAAVATDLITTRECYFTSGNLAKAVAGSCCLPYVFYPVELGGRHLVDGGLHNTIPSDIAKLMGCDYVLAVDAHSARTYGTDSRSAIEVIKCSFRVLMDNNVKKGYKYADIMISPETKNYHILKIENISDLIQEGYQATIDQMPQILALFNKKPKSEREKKRWLEKYESEEKELDKI